MPDMLFLFLLIIPIMIAAIGWMAQTHRHDYPLSRGAVDYKRIAWPVGKSGMYSPLVEPAEDAFPLHYKSPYNPPQNDMTNDALFLSIGRKLVEHGYLTEEQLSSDLASINIAVQSSSGYTPVLEDTDIVLASDEPYEQLVCEDVLHVPLPISEYTGQPYDPEWAVPLVKGGIPAPRVDRRLIGREYRCAKTQHITFDSVPDVGEDAWYW